MVQEEIAFKDVSYLELWQPISSVEWNNLCNLGKRHHKEQFCEIILNSDQLFRICRLKIFYLELWRPFFQPSGTICASLVEGILRNNSVIHFEYGPVVQEEMLF